MPTFFKEIDELLGSAAMEEGDSFITLCALNGRTKKIRYKSLQKERSDICIHEDVWLRCPQVVKSRIASLLGKTKKYHGRSTQVRRIDKKTSDQFLDQWHTSRYTSAYYKYGLFHKEELIAVATFSKSRVMHDSQALYRSYEWERFASKGNITIVGGLAKMLNQFLTDLNAVHVMTYIDKDWGNGNGFKAIGFKATEEKPPVEFLVRKGEWIRFNPEHIPANERESMIRIRNSGSIKMILDRRTP